MTQSPKPEHHSPSSVHKRLWLIVLSRGGIGLGGLLLITIAGGIWWLSTFVQKELTPLAQQNLTTILNRPVKLGKLREFSLMKVQFGASAIPATPTDPDQATVEAVEVGFDLWQLIFSRRLKLDVTLVNADVYIEQDQQGRWVTTKIVPPKKNVAIKTDLDILRFRNGKVRLMPQPRGKATTSSSPSSLPPISFSQLNGTAQLFDNNQHISFDLAGQADSGGNIAIQGVTRSRVLAGKFQLRGQDLLGGDITRLIKLPFYLPAGRVNGDLQQVQLTPGKPTLLFGTASLQGVTIQIPRLPQLLHNAQGNLRFQGTQVQVDNVTTSYGKIPLVAQGIIDTQAGFKLAARVNQVSLPNAQETLKVKLPVPVAGEVKADLQITGSTTQPILTGSVVTTKTARIDKVDFSSVSSNFEFTTSNSRVTLTDIQGKAKVGGEITGAGTIQLGKSPQLDLNFAAKNVLGDAIAKVYDITPNAQIGTISATAQLTGTPSDAQTLVRFQAPGGTYPGTGEVVVTANRIFTFQNVALNAGGGIVRVTGSYANQHWQGVAQASGVQLQPFVDKNQLQNVSLVGANFNGRLMLSGSTAPFKVATIRTEDAKVKIAGGTIAVSNVKLQDQNFSAQLIANNLQLGRILQNSPPVLDEPLAGTFQIAGNKDNFSLKTLSGTGEARLAVNGGTVAAKSIQFANGVYQAQIQANNVPVQRLAAVPPQFQGKLTGELNATGSVESFQLQTIKANGQGRVNLAGGTITAKNIQVANGVYQAQVQANNLPVQQLAAVPPQFQGGLTGQLNVAGSLGSFQPQTIQANGQGRLNLAGGTITASNIQVVNGDYQALVDASGVQLNRLNQQLRGLFDSRVQVVGTLGSAKLADVRAAGQVRLSQVIPGLQQPFTAAIAWNGEKLNIERATTRGLSVSGDILANANKPGIPEITALNLNVQAQNYNLQQLPINLPNKITVAGKADFNGQITGKLPLPNVAGQIKLRDLMVQNFAFDPILSGNIQSVQGRGLNLDLSGNQSDRIAVNLDANNRPKSLLLKWQQALASGQAQGDNFALKVENFPLQVLNLRPPGNLPLGKIAGLLTGDLLVNPQTFATTGNIAIAKPIIAYIKGDRLAAQFRYGNGKVTLTSSELIKGNSRYAFAGTLNQSSQKPQLQGKLNVSQGDVQDVLTVAQVFNFQNLSGTSSAKQTFGKAADLITNPQGLPNQSLSNQFKRFYEIDALLNKQEQQRLNANTIPDLADLKGTFNGEVTVDTATANGLAVQFNLNGEKFAWGKEDEPSRYYSADKVIAEGNFNNGILRLQPLRFESQKELISFIGDIGSKEQSGKLQINNIPLEKLNNFAKVPLEIKGNLNGTAAIGGSIANPRAIGELEITDATLTQKPIQSAIASFSYINGQLNFDSKVSVTGKEPENLTDITGNIPYKLPFASVAPDNEQINLIVNIKNEGLTLLNSLTNQVAFQLDKGGTGQVNLKVYGTLQQPKIEGIANVNNAIFSAPTLPDNLRNVTAQLRFDLDRILVENLQGKYSKGQVDAAGAIPLFDNGKVVINNPLTVNLDQLMLNIKGLYQGGASGNLQITGSALNPLIGGKVNLFNGQVLLAESTSNNTLLENNNVGLPIRKADKQNQAENGYSAKFNNLELELGKNVKVIRPPILSFRATGNLLVNGLLSQPIPDGTIRLEQGGVNLFTTQFNLVRGYEQTATFRPNQPRDPDLDVQLFAKVLDIVQNSDFTRPNSTGLAALESIRVEASVKGPASKLNQNLQLTSSPSRSQTEIVALLGGGFGDSEDRGDSTLGLINIAGSAVFNNFQGAFNQIADALGLSELRIFPTILSDNPEAGKTSSTLELAAEAGVDISPKFSISSIKILTASDPFQWGVNYRINDQFRVRASTNLDDDSRAVIEYQRRF